MQIVCFNCKVGFDPTVFLGHLIRDYIFFSSNKNYVTNFKLFKFVTLIDMYVHYFIRIYSYILNW